MDPDSADNLVTLRVDDADIVFLGIGDVNLIARGIGGDAGRAGAYGNRLHIPELQQVENADGITLAVGDVGVFVVVRRDCLALMAGRQAQRNQRQQQRGKFPANCFTHQRTAADPAAKGTAPERRAPGLATGSATVRFNTLAISRTSAMRASNCSGKSDCFPSLSARSGSG